MLNPPHLPHRGAPISYITSLEEFVLIQELIDEKIKKIFERRFTLSVCYVLI